MQEVWCREQVVNEGHHVVSTPGDRVLAEMDHVAAVPARLDAQRAEPICVQLVGEGWTVLQTDRRVEDQHREEALAASAAIPAVARRLPTDAQVLKGNLM